MKTFSEFLNEGQTIKLNVDFPSKKEKNKFIDLLSSNNISVSFKKGEYSEIAILNGKNKKQIITVLKPLGYAEEEFF